MGRATRWLRSLLTGRKDCGDATESPYHRRERKHRSFGKSTMDVEEGAAPADPACARHRSFQAAGAEDERSKRAASADAAAAAVRPTGEEGHGLVSGGARERWAATAIQTVYRGFLARKALRALRALVRLQALVRGYLVRRQAMAALHGMQALVRAQLTARIRRSRLLRSRRSLELFDEVKGDYAYYGWRLSSAADRAAGGFDGSARIAEIRPGARRPSYQWAGEEGDPPPAHRTSVPDRLCIFRDSDDWCLTGDECRSSTAQSTPRFMNRSGGAAAAIAAPQNFPNYMTKTQSFESKARCHSAPKQRPDPAGARRRTALCNELERPRRSLSGSRMQRSCPQVQDSMECKATVVGRLGLSGQPGSRAADRGLPSLTRW